MNDLEFDCKVREMELAHDLEWIRDHHFSQLEEGMTVSSLKQAIVTGVNSFTDEVKMNTILSLMFEEKIHHEVRNLLEQKGLLHHEMTVGMNQLMINAPGDVTEKVAFLREAQKKGFVNEKKLLTPGKLQNLSDVTRTKYPSILQDLTPKILNWTPQISTATIGRGELFFFLFAKNTYQGARGDLLVGNTEVEIKGKLARMVATKGYATSPSVYKEYFYAELKKKYPKAHKCGNHYNFNNSGIENLSDAYMAIDDGVWAREHLTMTFQKLYLQAEHGAIKKFARNVMARDGSLDVDKFITEFYGFQYDYYQQIDGWDGILYLNPKNANLLYIKTADALKQSLDKFAAAKSFSWKEGRNVTYQLTLK